MDADAEIAVLRGELRANERVVSSLEKTVDSLASEVRRHAGLLDDLRGVREEVAEVKANQAALATSFKGIRRDFSEALVKLRDEIKVSAEKEEERATSSAQLEAQVRYHRLMKVSLVVSTSVSILAIVASIIVTVYRG